MNRSKFSPKHLGGIATVMALLALPTSPAFSAESNETDLNKQQVTPPGSTRASSPAKDDVIYQPSTGTFKTGEELQEERDRKLNPDAYDKTPKPTDVPPPMPETR
jgi:hypothetical protein